jgi:peptidoglycan hydrolase-like protein with peptidoglycan-binding domain
MTAIALQTFQEDHGETGDAIVGPATMAVLSDAAAEGGQSASYDVSAEEDDLEAVAQGVALPEGRVHNLFRKELLEEACGVPAKRYKIRRR